MAKVRCKETSVDSFFGNFLYDQKVSRNHFLRKLNEIIDWSCFTNRLLRYYRGKGEVGQAPYNPAIILKMLLLSYLTCGMSRREWWRNWLTIACPLLSF